MFPIEVSVKKLGGVLALSIYCAMLLSTASESTDRTTYSALLSKSTLRPLLVDSQRGRLNKQTVSA
jgi:hypothetical protein